MLAKLAYHLFRSPAWYRDAVRSPCFANDHDHGTNAEGSFLMSMGLFSSLL